jgi:histidinol phosphatase-like PHP family hydrolase/predicted nuclease with RNAse H fold/dephospho-CoA kinase
MTKSSKPTHRNREGTRGRAEVRITGDYFRLRDFEYAQPLYDLAFLLEVDAIDNGQEIPKYRTFSLWRAAYSLDGYGTTIDRWLDGTLTDQDLDSVPSSRIRQYLTNIRLSGTIPELRRYSDARYERCLRLRSVRGLGPSKIALTLSRNTVETDWIGQVINNVTASRSHLTGLFHGTTYGPWQTAHIVPPLLRFLHSLEKISGASHLWNVLGINDPFKPITSRIWMATKSSFESFGHLIGRVLDENKHFQVVTVPKPNSFEIKHQMGWRFVIESNSAKPGHESILDLARRLDPIAALPSTDVLADLHLHTAWSDGNASVNTMARAVASSGLQYFAVTDHSRTSKLQGGLTPLLWLRQENALTLATTVCPILHGIEVDILKDGTLDLPESLLAAADIVVASVHSNWTEDSRVNTDRLIRAIESGCVDVLAHPTSAVVGIPGSPDYIRDPAPVQWEEVFEKCALWCVAVEMNCFPSRLDLPLHLLKSAILAGCAISLGSDSHARSHLLNLRFGMAALRELEETLVLNRFSYPELQRWVAQSRRQRQGLSKTICAPRQSKLFISEDDRRPPVVTARIQRPQEIPLGSRIVGLDLTAGDKATGVAVLDGYAVETCSAYSDEEILVYIENHRPAIVSIDSPLGLPGGGESINPSAGIVRVAEQELASIGIPAYPALIDSMRNLTLRGIRIKRAIEQLPDKPTVIESYPGAAQDILCIPRKQKSLELLREGLHRLGLKGSGLKTRSHDEMDAITAALVGRYYESGEFEPMGIGSEAQLIIPKIQPLVFETNPIICLAGKTGAGKSVVARYLSVFYGFKWIRTRDVIRELLLDDLGKISSKRLFQGKVDPNAISENDLREFGALILNVHRQMPLRTKLASIIERTDAPVVIDSIRDSIDVNADWHSNRPLITMFVDCSETVIQQRLATRRKVDEKVMTTGSPVDRTAPSLRDAANLIVPNNGSLEELRWHIDDSLFQAITLSK